MVAINPVSSNGLVPTNCTLISLIEAHAGGNSVAMEYLLVTVSPWLVSFTVYILKGMIGEILFKFASKLP